MFIDKKSILNLFFNASGDNALEPFYQNFGPCIRSEYCLDDDKIVDLDWENFGCVVTFINSKISQIRLQATLQDENNFNGWLGDGVKEGLSADEIKSLWGEANDFIYPQERYLLGFEFSESDLLESVVLSVNI